MIAWILEPGEDYHDRDFEGLSDNMKENAMLKTLIQEGLVSEGAVDDEIFWEYQDPSSTVVQKRGDLTKKIKSTKHPPHLAITVMVWFV